MNTEKLTPEQKKAVEDFTELITRHSDMQMLEKVLDSSIWLVTCKKLTDTDFTGNGNATEEIYYLRLLKEVCGGRVSWPQ